MVWDPPGLRFNHLYRATVGFARALQWEMQAINKELDNMKNDMQNTVQSLNKVDDLGGPLLGK